MKTTIKLVYLRGKFFLLNEENNKLKTRTPFPQNLGFLTFPTRIYTVFMGELSSTIQVKYIWSYEHSHHGGFLEPRTFCFFPKTSFSIYFVEFAFSGCFQYPPHFWHVFFRLPRPERVPLSPPPKIHASTKTMFF